MRAKIGAARLTRDASLASYRRGAQTVAYDVVVPAMYLVIGDLGLQLARVSQKLSGRTPAKAAKAAG